MNRFVGPLIYAIARGIGNFFGIDTGDWITIILMLLLFVVVAIVLYAICVFVYLYIKDLLHNIKINSIKKRQDYRWFERIMEKTCTNGSATIEVNTKDYTLQFKPDKKLRYSYLIGSENMTIVIDKDVMLLSPLETEEGLNKQVMQFKADNEQLLNDCTVKDVVADFSKGDYSMQMLLYFVLAKDSINIHQLPVLNNALLKFIETLSCDMVKKDIKLLLNETSEVFIEKCYKAFKEHALDVPKESCFFSICNMFNMPYMSVCVYINHRHPLITKLDVIENALDKLAVSQNESWDNNNNMSMEDALNIFKDVFGDSKA